MDRRTDLEHGRDVEVIVKSVPCYAEENNIIGRRSDRSQLFSNLQIKEDIPLINSIFLNLFTKFNVELNVSGLFKTYLKPALSVS